MANARGLRSDTFPGTIPRFSDGRQINQWATTAHNVRRETSSLRAMPKPKLVCEVGAAIRTIYETKDCECITFDACIDIAEIPCPDPEREDQVMWTGDNRPYIATVSEFCEGERCRTGPYCPRMPPSFSGPGCSTPGCETQNYSYVYTYKNKYGDESAPSPPAPLQQGSYTSGVTVTIPPPSPQQPDASLWCITEICIYRLGTGYKSGAEQQTTTTGSWWLVACVPFGTETFFDDMSRPKPYRLQTWGMAHQDRDAENVVSIPTGQVAWTLGSSVVLSPPNRPTLYGVTNQSYEIDLKCEVQRLCEWYGSLYAWTTDGALFKIGIETQNGRYRLTPVKYPECRMPLCSRQAMVKTKSAIYYASTDGIVAITGDGPQLITEQLFTREQWCNECCGSMVMGMCYGDLVLRGKYKTYLIPVNDSTYSTPETAGISTIDIRPTTFYTRRDGTVLFGAEDGNVYELPKCVEECCDCCDAHYMTPVFRSGCPVDYEAMRVWLRPEYGAVDVCIYAFDCGVRRLIYEKQVVNCEPFILPQCGQFNHWQIEFKFCSGCIDGWELSPDIAAFGESNAA